MLASRSSTGQVSIIAEVLEVEGSAEKAPATVYNVEVEDFHTYFAGPGRAWVHNNGCGQGKGPFLVRFGRAAESADKLAADAAKAEAKGFPHGVSTKQVAKLSGSDKAHRAALKADVEQSFVVEQTGRDSAHHTVHLPKPVTPEVADRFNTVFPPKD